MKLADYISWLEKNNTGVVYKDQNYFWVDYENKAAVRSPAFFLESPPGGEVKEVINKLSPVFLTYNVESRLGDHNAFLYFSSNSNYDLEKLDKNGRRDARIGLRNFEFKLSDWDNVLENGFKAFSDTRARNGLSDGTKKNFEKIFTECKAAPAYKTLVAVKPGEKEIIAFLHVIELEDWVEISGAYSQNESLKFCPNNGLFHFAFEHFLKEGKKRVVSYGISSLQKSSKKDSLHDFKLRLGFEAKPIKRIFIVNPRYKPLINRYSHSIVKLLLKIFPHDRRMNKLEGVMSILNNAKNEKVDE